MNELFDFSDDDEGRRRPRRPERGSGARPQPTRDPHQRANDTLKKLGGILIGICFACLLVGRAIVALFFPERIGKGIKDDTLWILIPIWSIGIIGVVLLILGIVPVGKTANARPKPAERPANPLRRREKAGTEEEPLDLD